MMKRVWSTLSTLSILAILSGCNAGAEQATLPSDSETRQRSTSTTSALDPSVSPVPSVSPTTSRTPVSETIATGLSVPWGLALLPDGTALVCLRDQGKVLRTGKTTSAVSVGNVPDVEPDGEGGLLGIAVSPTFASDRAVFVYLTSREDNRVIRMILRGSTLIPGRVIVKGIPKATNHNGGRLAFGPDNYLYISTGDAGRRDSAQNKASLGGKILRVTGEGTAAPGNPFPLSPVWSLGHRNVQGMAWDRAGTMYASEFGQDNWDELNRIEIGRNYGWPSVEGIAHRPGFVDPIIAWRPADASPSGIAVGTDGVVYIAALRGESLWRIPLDGKGGAGTPERLLQGRYGRLRTVVSAPDGRLWLVTSNTFRGAARPGDDRILALRLPVR